jgi:quercetin dioxygenase-like cupin family protein
MPEKPPDETAIPNHGSTEPPTLPDNFEGGAFIDLHGAVALLRSDNASKGQAGRESRLLIKYPEFRIVLITMRAGSTWEEHKTASRILIQTLLGYIRFHTPNGTFELRPGQLLILDPDIVHSVDAPEESAFLLSLFSANQQ